MPKQEVVSQQLAFIRGVLVNIGVPIDQESNVFLLRRRDGSEDLIHGLYPQFTEGHRS